MDKVVLTEQELIIRANQELKCYPGYIDGMKIESARMEKHILVMYGDCFLKNGLPTERTTQALHVYNEFGNDFSKKYTLPQLS